MIYDANHIISFTICRAGDGMDNSLKWFLDENNVKFRLDFENGFDN